MVARIVIYLVWAVCFFVSLGTGSATLLLVCAVLAAVVAVGDAVVVFSPLVTGPGFQLARFWQPTFGIALLTALLRLFGPKVGPEHEQLTVVLAVGALLVAVVTAVRSQRMLRAW